MAQKTDSQLQTDRGVIENETATAANTAVRVGNHFEDIIDSKINNDRVDTAVTLDTAGKDIADKDAIKAYVAANAGGVGHVIEDEGTPLAQQTNLNFVGAGVTATDAGGKTVVTIPDGGSGKLSIADFAKYILDQASADTSGATITLDMNSQVQRSFVGSASFSAAKAIALSNTTNSLCFNFVYTITNVTAVLTFPTEFQSKDPNWDSGANTWTPAEAGKYELGASYDGTNWIVKFFGAIS